MRHVRWIAIGIALTVGGLAWAGEPRLQRLNLDDTPSKPRFEITGRVWPQRHGDTDLCLWADDKLACVTFGVDDNISPEHDWWLEMGERYNFRNTWFVIVYPQMYNYDGSAGKNQGYFGTLATFQRLFDAGHDVQPHGTTAINRLSRAEYEKDVRFTQDMLRRIPGNSANTYAYPGGASDEHKREVVAKLCIGARGTVGGINRVNRTDYLCINTGQVTEETLAGMLDDPKSPSYRGWLSQFVHSIATSSDPITRQSLYDDFELRLKRVHDRRADIWVPTYREAFLYGQSRDTARLTPRAVAPGEIRFTLIDDMNDDVYTYPLTVKVRVNDDWDAVEATQAGRNIDSELVLHEGGKFLLVKVVPDQGEVVLAKGLPAVCLPPVICPASGKYRDKVEIRLTSPTSNAQIRYAIGDADPGPNSPLYEKPVVIHGDAKVAFKAACFREDLRPSPAADAMYDVRLDKQPPTLVAADSVSGTSFVGLTFSEMVHRNSAETPANYTISGIVVEKAVLQADGATVILHTANPTTGPATIAVRGVEDLSGNPIAQQDPATLRVGTAATTDGLVGHFRFDESPNATCVLDSCGTAAPGLIEGAFRRAANDKGPAIAFDGRTSLSIPNCTFDLDKSNAFSVAFWVRFDGALKGQLVKKGRYAVPFSARGYAGRQAIQVYARIGRDIRVDLPGKIQRKVWTHVGLAVGDDKLAVYKNGEEVATERLAIKVKCPNEPVFLGEGFTGMIADLRIYNRALNSQQIAGLAGILLQRP